jgi:2',3'-cyclic-nucleotide 2'-phosphodiesterase (5'-nucleotidase family)
MFKKSIYIIILFFSFFVFADEAKIKLNSNGVFYWYQEIDSDAPKEIKITFASDMHSSVHKWAHVETFLKNRMSNINKNSEHWLLLGGDYVQGEGDFDLRNKGEINYEIISKSKNIVAAAIGNHDLNIDMIDPGAMGKKYGIPLISSNIFYKQNNNFAYPAYIIRKYKDKTFLFLSFVDDGPNYDLEFSKTKYIEEPTDAFIKLAPIIAMNHKFDETIFVNHLGEKDAIKLTKLTNKVKLQFNGHQHTIRLEHYKNRKGFYVPTICGGYRNNSVQLANLIYDKANGFYIYKKNSYRSVPVKQFKKDLKTVNFIKEFIKNNPLPEEYKYLEKGLFTYMAPSKKEKFSSSRSFLGNTDLISAPFPNLVNDAFRHKLNASLSFFNSDGLRKNIKQREEKNYLVRSMDVYNAIPFENNLYYAYMTGREITDLTHMVIYSFPKNRRGYFTGVKGKNENGKFKAERIFNPETGKYEIIEKYKTYKVVMSDFYAEEHPIFKAFLEKNNIECIKTEFIDHRVVIDYINNLKKEDPNWIARYQRRNEYCMKILGVIRETLKSF